jgi:hypothetical protein
MVLAIYNWSRNDMKMPTSIKLIVGSMFVTSAFLVFSVFLFLCMFKDSLSSGPGLFSVVVVAGLVSLFLALNVRCTIGFIKGDGSLRKSYIRLCLLFCLLGVYMSVQPVFENVNIDKALGYIVWGVGILSFYASQIVALVYDKGAIGYLSAQSAATQD